METPKPMQGTWTLTAPDGRQWQAESPLRTVSLEQRERVPADVALGRVLPNRQPGENRAAHRARLKRERREAKAGKVAA